MDDRVATGRDILVGIDIIVGAARPAMQDDQRGATTIQVTRDAVPGLIVAERGKTFMRFDEFHFIRLRANREAHNIATHDEA
ncbi:hypothetical protein D9M71_759650 [compost metagenome]